MSTPRHSPRRLPARLLPLVAGLLLSLSPGLAAGSPAARMAWVGFEAGAGVETAEAEALSSFLESELAAGAPQVIGPGQLDSELGGGALKAFAGCKDRVDCLAREGSARVVEYVAQGRVTRIGKRVLIELRLVETASGRQIFHDRANAEAEASLEPALDLLPGLAKGALAATRDAGDAFTPPTVAAAPSEPAPSGFVAPPAPPTDEAPAPEGDPDGAAEPSGFVSPRAPEDDAQRDDARPTRPTPSPDGAGLGRHNAALFLITEQVNPQSAGFVYTTYGRGLYARFGLTIAPEFNPGGLSFIPARAILDALWDPYRWDSGSLYLGLGASFPGLFRTPGGRVLLGVEQTLVYLGERPLIAFIEADLEAYDLFVASSTVQIFPFITAGVGLGW